MKLNVPAASIAGCFEKREFVDLLLHRRRYSELQALDCDYDPLDPESLLATQVPNPGR